MYGMGAVAIVVVAFEVAAANSRYRCRHCDVNVVARFVGEVIDAWEPAFAEVVRYRLESDAHIAYVAAGPHYAAPTLVEGVATVCYCERCSCICYQCRCEVYCEHVAVLREAAHGCTSRCHCADCQCLKLQFDGAGLIDSCQCDDCLRLQCMVSEIDVVQMNLIMCHIDVFARSLCCSEPCRENQDNGKEFFHNLNY